MEKNKNTIEKLGDLLDFVELADSPSCQRRDMKSAINRVAEMAGMVPPMVEADAPVLRTMLKRVRPAAHGAKTEDLGEPGQSAPRRPAACRADRS